MLGAAILHQVLSETLDTQAETIRKIQQAFGNDSMGSLKLKICSTALKMAACRWTLTSIAGDHQ
jgi:hypothetical protein